MLAIAACILIHLSNIHVDPMRAQPLRDLDQLAIRLRCFAQLGRQRAGQDTWHTVHAPTAFSPLRVHLYFRVRGIGGLAQSARARNVHLNDDVSTSQQNCERRLLFCHAAK